MRKRKHSAEGEAGSSVRQRIDQLSITGGSNNHINCVFNTVTESYTARMAVDEVRHSEIKALIENRNSETPQVQLPCYLLPYSRNAGYFGHKAALEACKQRFETPHTSSSVQSYALYGVGGVGKTSVALECVYALKSTYSVILWLFADTKSKLLTSFGDAAKRLFGSFSADPDQDRERVLLWLYQTSTHEPR